MLDPQGKKSINEQIRKLHEQKNVTIISITHDMEEVAQSEYVIVLRDGQVEMSGRPMEIFRQEKRLKEMKLDVPFALKFSDLLIKEGVEIERECTLEGVVQQLCQLKQIN